MKQCAENACKQEIEWIKDVARTNLMAADRMTFGKLTGRDLSQNSVATNLKNATPFIVHAIWNELSRMVEEKSRGHLTLEEVLKRYKKASDYCYMHKYLMHYDEAKLALLLDYAFFEDTQLMPDRDKRLDPKWTMMEQADVDIRLVLLICLKVLPRYSGRSKPADFPLATLREFLHYYITREDFPYRENLPYLQMIVDESIDIYDRMAAITVLVNFCITTCELSTTRPAAKRNQNKTSLKGIVVQDGTDSPLLWQEEGKMTTFWYLIETQDSYIMRKCDYSKREYIDYTLHLGTEFSRDTCRLLDPHFILNMAENRSAYEYLMLMKWNCQKDVDGHIIVLEFDSLSSWHTRDNWAEPLRHLRLRRMDSSTDYYQKFAECLFKSSDSLYTLSHNFTNRYPETYYYFAPTLYAITRDYLVVQDIRLNEDGQYDYVPNRFFHLPRKYASLDCRLSDPIGLLVVGGDPSKQKKYIIIDDIQTCCPIEQCRISEHPNPPFENPETEKSQEDASHHPK